MLFDVLKNLKRLNSAEQKNKFSDMAEQKNSNEKDEQNPACSIKSW